MEEKLNNEHGESSFCDTSNRTIEYFTFIELFNLAKQGNKEAEALLDMKFSALGSKSKGNKNAD